MTVSNVGVNIAEKATLIWNVADMLRGPFKPHEYGLVILPMTVVKRFHDCLLPNHAKMLETYEKFKHLEVVDGFLTRASGYQFYNTSKYLEAYEAFVSLNGHKDSAAKASAILNEHLQIKYTTAKVGSYITFGTYEQDANTGNGKEDIEWLVLAKENNHLLVISRYALDCKPYNEKGTSVTWETCTLRKWLNNDFLKAAFSFTEQTMIPTVTVSADKNPAWSTNPGNATQDKVFLLSIPDVNKYFTSDSARQCKPTAYAKKQGAYTNDSGFCWWWLRSLGSYQFYAAHVNIVGGVYEYGDIVCSDNYAVRPALWINPEP